MYYHIGGRRHQSRSDYMKGTNVIMLVRSRDFEKKLKFHLDKNFGHETSTTGRFRHTNSFQTNLKDNDIIILRLLYFCSVLMLTKLLQQDWH